MANKAANKNKDDLSAETSSQRILLEEFRLLQDRYLHYRAQGIARTNFFITSASVAIGGVLVFGSSNNNLPFRYFELILLVTLLVLAAIGFDLYYY